MSTTEPHVYEEYGWTVTPLTGTFGAELSGKNLGEEEDALNVRSLLERHLVLSFRGQFLTHGQQSKLAHAMGEPTPAHPVVPGHPDFPEMLVLDGALGGKNALWHTDVTFIESPPAISILVNDHTPVAGGDTLWSDTRTAYERLHPSLRDAFDELEAVHRITPLAYWGEPFDGALTREDAQYLYDEAQKVPPVVHPVIRRHPSTGRPSVFVNPGFTSHILGVSRIESENLLGLLFEHMTQPELTLRHHWLEGDVVLWDNRATMHYATDDYGTSERRMRRITLRGTRPAGVHGAESRVVTDPLLGVR